VTPGFVTVWKFSVLSPGKRITINRIRGLLLSVEEEVNSA